MFEINKNFNRLSIFISKFIMDLAQVFFLSLTKVLKSLISIVVVAVGYFYYSFKDPENLYTRIKEKHDSIFNFFKFNSSIFSISINEKTVELLIFISLFQLFCVYALFGNSNVIFSNEGIWLVALSFAVVFGNVYYQTNFAGQKSQFEIQVTNITNMLSHSAELVLDINELEQSLLAEQVFMTEQLEVIYLSLSGLENRDDLYFNNYSDFFESFLNDVFQDHLRYLSTLNFFREDLVTVVELKDLNDEIVLENFVESDENV